MEKKFLNFALTEGVVLTVLGLCMLALPKISTLAMGVMVSIAFFIYGIYKFINSVLTRKYRDDFWLNIALSFLLITLGILMFLQPVFNLVFITSLIGIYFILESISSLLFSIQYKNLFSFWWTIFIMSILQLALGLIILVALPSSAFWVIGILVGVEFLIAGMSLMSLFISNKNV